MFLENLQKIGIEGEIHFDELYRTMYATDASVYREMPLAVVYPKNSSDIQRLILFAKETGIALIPRGAGTSLAGQVVGNGIVVDCSRFLNRILELNVEERWVWVEPGVVLDDLNRFLRPYHLFFAPETSTASRCTIGGMSGNNACGLHSLIYGSTREHTIAINAFLSDGSEVVFEPLNTTEFQEKCRLSTLEGTIYRQFLQLFSNETLRKEIAEQYPDKRLMRRNHGYALDMLADGAPFNENGTPFNICKLLSGSEGTLAFATKLKLNLLPIIPAALGLLCIHHERFEEALHANLIALKHHPSAVELMDKSILDLAKYNIEQERNRFFIQGDPEAILMVELSETTLQDVENKSKKLIEELQQAGLGYYYYLALNGDIQRVWNLRKAGLGILSNLKGDDRPVSVVEDTAVLPEYLPDYIADFQKLLQHYHLSCTFHAHIATGELHLRPLINLKTTEGVELFRTIARETAVLVKKYRGSLSGEHGDGRLRGGFIPLMYGETIYQTFCEIKDLWDPNRILNPGKIIDTPPMSESLRYVAGKKERNIETFFDFSEADGLIRAAEKCNGSADCRKKNGFLCPTFQATSDEKYSTRARANLLREMLSFSDISNPFDSKQLYEILDACLMCKACKSECPSSVDMAKMKMEFLQHYNDCHRVTFRSWMIAHLPNIHKLASLFPRISNFLISKKITKRILNFAPQRNIAAYSKKTFRKAVKKQLSKNPENPIRTVYFFIDEFTNFNDSTIGIQAVDILQRLGYSVIIPKTSWSGRTWLSKGFLRKAKRLAYQNIQNLALLTDRQKTLIGIEPSTILTFRDEYPDLVDENLKKQAQMIAENSLLFDEFIAQEIDAGHISSSQFTKKPLKIALHGHCQQKAIASTATTIKMLSLPKNYEVEEIPSGCCGMAGAFGYEKEHYELSMKIGETTLFPAIRQYDAQIVIAASGTSCRQQIKDGTGRIAQHPVSILWEAMEELGL